MRYKYSNLILSLSTCDSTLTECHYILIPRHPSVHRKLLEEISKVTIDDMRTIGGKIVKSLFDSKLSKSALVCNPAKVEDITKDFHQFVTLILLTLLTILILLNLLNPAFFILFIYKSHSNSLFNH